MKQKFSFVILCLLLSLFSNAQITKGFWMFGGSGNVITNKSEQLIGTSKFTGIYLTPNTGHFLLNNLATGIKVNFTFTKSKFSNNSPSKNSSWEIGPFVRYYFLKHDNRLNILSEASFAYRLNSVNSDKSSDFDYQFLVGPVFFLNSTIGLEIIGGYKTGKSGSINFEGFRLNIGLQIHLDRERE